MTLVFCPVQALACAQAGASVISPFVGRVKDWWEAHPAKLKSDDLEMSSQHPGIALIHQIRDIFNTFGYSGKTQVMACGFRNIDEVIEVAQAGKNGGVDLLTLQLALLDELRIHDRVAHVTVRLGRPPLRMPEPTYLPSATRGHQAKDSRRRFDHDLEKEMIALDKVPEGLAKFVKDMWGLEGLILHRLEAGGYQSVFWNERVRVPVGSVFRSD
jgi:transaldolase